MDPILTSRLALLPFTPDALDALLVRDRTSLERLTGARFPDPLVAPPLMEDALPFMRDRLRAAPGDLGWWSWLVRQRDDARAVGSVGFGGHPDPDGAVVLGYATYPGAQGRGYATEACQALVEWAWTHPEAKRVCATVPAWNTSSIRVAEKLGMRKVGLIWEEDLGEDVELWAVGRPG